MNSIRIRLMASICGCLLVVFALAGLFLNSYLRHVLESNFDASLLTKAETFARTTEQQPGGTLDFEFLESNLPEYSSASHAEYYQVWRETGETLVRSPSLGSQDLPFPATISEGAEFRDLALPDGQRGRIVAIRFMPHMGENAVQPAEQLRMALAAPRTGLDTALSRIVDGLLFTALALITCAFPAVWWAVRRHLVSLGTIGEQARSIDAGNLSFRFPTKPMPAELLPVCHRLNNLLERLEGAFNRERRFTADAAHELRTPIAELRTLAEVGITEAANNAPAMSEYFNDTLEIARHLETLVTTLLALTRCEAGLQQLERRRVEMGRVVQEVWSGYERQARERGLLPRCDIADHAQIETDEDLFKAILSNIFSNAVSYTPRGGEIALSVRYDLNSVVLILANTNHELRTEDLGYIFDPFWRKEQERTNVDHCGVGLSLVAAYARILNMKVDAGIPSEGWFEITVRCPLPR